MEGALVIVVKVTRLPPTRHPRQRYTLEDWRVDVRQTRFCQVCREPATFYADETAECIRCGLWFDGLITGSRRDDLF